MAALENCAWITHAFLEEDVEMALVLGKSLRRVLTRAKLVITVGRLSRIERQRFVEIFDWVLPLNEDFAELRDTVSCEYMAFLTGMGLTAITKCVYLHPHGIVLKNTDWIFNGKKEVKESLSLEATDWKIRPVFFEPSKIVYNRISKDLIENPQTEDALDCAKPNVEDIVGFIKDPLFVSVDVGSESEYSFGDIENVEIIHLKNFARVQESLKSESCFLTEKTGLMEKQLQEMWLEIYKTAGFPLNQDQHFIKNKAYLHEPIAVVGMACRLPSANNLNEFWDLMIERKDAIRTPPSHRWTKEQIGYTLPGSENTLAGFLSDPIEEFDAKFFEISPNEAEYIDPQHRLLMEVVWESLENAGINPQNLKGTSTGVFVGKWFDNYKGLLESEGRSRDFFRTALGNAIGVGAARISHLLKLTGPTLGIESDCAASAVMVHQACKSLQRGESDLALAAGVNLLIKPFLLEDGKSFLAPDGHCKTFDADANGFARGEGCATLVLKRVSDAIRDNNHIWGLIRGSCVSQEGLSSSLGTPTVYGQSLAMEGALRDANVNPKEVSYVEAHGTGTVVGDSVELGVIKKIYGNCDRKDDLFIGSVKTNIGHTESCSGIAGIIKVLLAMSHDKIPPHRNFKKLNLNVDITGIPAKIPLEAVTWPRTIGETRIGAVSSYGLGGVNTHLILEESPQFHQITSQPFSLSQMTRPITAVQVSAKSGEALDNLLEKYEKLLEDEDGKHKVEDIAYTTNTGRASFPFKAVMTVDNSCKTIKICKKQENDTSKNFGHKNHLCFLFTGQGSQYHGMAKELYETSPVFRFHFDVSANFLQRNYNISLVDTYLSANETENCHRTLFSQTGIFAVQYGLMKLWESWGIKPNFVMGHSLGEFCAAVCAGILDIEDALTLVAERSRLIDSLPTGKMIVVMANRGATAKLQNEFISSTGNPALDIAALNSEEQTVLAGDTEVVNQFAEFLKSKKGVKCSLLKSSHAFHSHHMDPILEEYRNIVTKIKYRNPSDGCTYISGMLGTPLNGENRKIDSEYWIQHTRKHVDFLTASKVACEDFDCRLFVEIGPTPILSAFVMMNNAKLSLENLECLPSLRRNDNNWKTLITTLEGLVINRDFEINWHGFDQFYERKNVGHLLPSHPYKKVRFWPRLNSLKASVIHPLLGCNMPNASVSKIFQSDLTVDNAAYLKDHAIGDLLVFPGAGFIEMILAAGNCCLLGDGNKLIQNSTGPICLSNFKIKGPLGLNEDGTLTTCQTIFQFPNSSDESESDIGNHVEIFHLENQLGSAEWMSHASGHVLLQMEYNMDYIDNKRHKFLDHIHYDEQSNSEIISDGKIYVDEHNVADFYSNIRDTGINFGSEFKSIKRIWSNPGSDFSLGEVDVPKDADQYLLHPILIDAMIQQSAFSLNDNSNKKLRVPVGCDQFILFSNVTTSKCYIYSDISTNSAALINEDGKLIAIILNLQLAETTIDKIKSAIDSTAQLPYFLKKEYRQERLGHSEKRAVLPLTPDGISVLATNSPALNSAMEEDVQMRAYFNKLSLSYIKNAFSKMGWNFEVGESINFQVVRQSLKIDEKYKLPVEQYLRFLCEDGILGECNGQKEVPTWLVTQLFPSEAETSQDIKCLLQQHQTNAKILGKWGEAISLFQTVGENLVSAFRRKTSVLPILFPEDNQKASVTKFYEAIFSNLSDFLYSIWKKQFEEIIQKYGSDPSKLPTLRILEIGAGSGGITGYLLKALTDAGIPFEYVYSDISAAFFSSAEKRFSEYVGSMKFKKLNIEENPISQGFPPQYFDIIVTALVLHIAEDIQKALRNVRVLLRDGGNLWFTETSAPTPHVDFLFGLLADYWRFTDYDLRPYHNTLSAEKWTSVLKQVRFADSGYIDIDNNLILTSLADKQSVSPSSQCVVDGKNWLIFHGDHDEWIATNIQQHMSPLGMPNVSTINCTLQKETETFTKEEFWKNNVIEGIIFTIGACGTETCQENTAKPYLNLLQCILKYYPTAKIFLITSGQYAVEDNVCENPSAATLIGITTTAINEYKDVHFKIIDVCPSEIGNSKRIIQQIFYDLDSQRAPVVVLRGDSIYRPIFTMAKPNSNADRLSLDNLNRFQLSLPKTGELTDLQVQPLQQSKIKNNYVEIAVKFTGLNFRDVLTVLMPSEDFKLEAGLGADFVGIVTKRGKLVTRWNVGDEVFGMKLKNNVEENQHFPSHICISEDAIEKVPSTFTSGEAVCLPTVFATAYYSLVSLAKAKKGETVLIHSASGALGLITIQVAMKLKLNIICTAGSTKKRNYLTSIGIKHVFDSRSTDFQTDILRVTEQKGVDIVINSLTGEGFKEATLATCGRNARFVELSKINIWTTEEVNCLRPDVQYFPLMVATLEKDITNSLLGMLKVWMEEGKVKPIPYVRYDANDIKSALKYFKQAKHIGKIICGMPQPRPKHYGNCLSANKQKFTPLFNEKSTYLITGGLGGIGLEVCKYMIQQGAKNIVLTGRTPPSGDIMETLNSMGKGLNIQFMMGDVGSQTDCTKIFQKIKEEFPPLRGVMHSAGCLDDGVLENRQWENFQMTYRSKVEGTWNLHNLTKDMILEHFVLFSSMMAELAVPGQSTHVSACAFQDRFAQYRNSLGMPATSINWGQWGDVGIAAQKTVFFIKPFSVQQGVAAIDAILRTNELQMGASFFQDNTSENIQLLPYTKWTLDKQLYNNSNQKSSPTHRMKLSSVKFWEDVDNCGTDSKMKMDVIKSYAESVVKQVLKLEPSEKIDETTKFHTYGFDSLMMIELGNRFQLLVGNKVIIPQTVIKESTTVKELGDTLVKIIENELEDLTPPTVEEMYSLCLKDSKLPEDIRPENPGSEIAPSQIKKILLTGVTGYIGSQILKELLENYPRLETIYCLVRGKQADKRLDTVLETNCLNIEQTLMKKVVFVYGDFVENNFGLGESQYNNLCSAVEAILHFGCKVNHYEHYMEIPNSVSDVRSVNVTGVLNILRFACKTKTKHILFPSNVGVFNAVDMGNMETFADINNLSCIQSTMGYPISKVVDETLLKEAIFGRGIPCKIFRFSDFLPPKALQKSFMERSFIIKFFLLSIIERVIPSVPVTPVFIPIDQAAEIAMHVFFQDEAPHSVYNVIHPQTAIVPDNFFSKETKLDRADFDTYCNRLSAKCFTLIELLKGNEKPSGIQNLLFEIPIFTADPNLYVFLEEILRNLSERFYKNKDFAVSPNLMKYAKDLYLNLENGEETFGRTLNLAQKESFYNLISSKKYNIFSPRKSRSA